MLCVYVDDVLATVFDTLKEDCTTTTSSSSSSCPAVSITRRTNTVAQSILLTCHTTCNATTQAVASNVHLVVLIESTQLARLLPVQRRAGTGRRAELLHSYLDRVCEATKEAEMNIMKSNVNREKTFTIHLVVSPHIIQGHVGNTATRSTTINSTSGVSAGLAAQFHAEAFAWSLQHHSMNEGTRAKEESRRYKIRLGLCAAVESNSTAVAHVRALVHSLQRHWPLHVSSPTAVNNLISTSVTTGVAGKRGRDEDTHSVHSHCHIAQPLTVRPDTQRKCDPNDFHKLYAAMLSEVTSFSERKTLAAMSAFPTMYHLLDYIDRNVVALQQDADSNSSSVPVYRSNYGEGRAWNVINEAVIDALITDYRTTAAVTTLPGDEESMPHEACGSCSSDEDNDQ